MPVIKSAKKKLRQDRKRTALNKKFEDLFRKLIKQAEKNSTEANIRKAVVAIDKAAKKDIIHKNKASRLKSNLSKLLKREKKTPTKNLKATPKSSSKRKSSKIKKKK
ncbi:MAG: hypothetical protein ACD_50C00352G0002 [uncultured bacterium]|nr:MAG: hypothetical protein ACD_50C00352G0002 [uncultured bacterium]OGH13747.1 MAG: hypothetical protein A2687_03065 [Candidatus Levybacteria bacterium RIFCSPHIGHO2_01_FULL_38_26]